MQTLVAPATAERVFNVFMLHCSATMIRGRLARSRGIKLEYTETVFELCKGLSGSPSEIIDGGIEKAIAWFAKENDYTIEYARQWLTDQTDAFYQKMVKECRNERDIELCIQSVEDLLLKPLRRKVGGEICN